MHKELTYECNQCDFKVVEEDSLKIHFIESNHEGMGFGCNQCEFKASKRITMARHKQLTHTEYGMACRYLKPLKDIRKDS